MNIAYFLSDEGGCSYYRAMLPLDTLYDQKLADVMRINKGDVSERVATGFAEADVVVFPRVSGNPTMFRLMESLKEDGKIVVTDYDDNIWRVTPLSQHYMDYGLVEYQHVIRDASGAKQRINVWKDGVKNFSIKRNRERLLGAEKALGLADLVTTTTDILAEVLRQYNPNVAVLPNCVDMRRWRRLPMKPHDELRIFWAGGASHFEDWLILENVLPVVMERFPRVKLVLLGVKFNGVFKNLPPDRVEFHQWENNLSYPYKSAILDADLCVIPLVDNAFNRCKSPIKWVEQSALGVPSVVSMVSPYAEIYDGENAVMVADNDRDAWIEAISTLLRDPVLRAKIGGKAQRYVEARFDIERRAVDWLNAYQAEAQKKHANCEELCLSQP